jgi:hypothetical protein
MANVNDYGGPDSVDYIEIEGESRNFSVSKKSISKTFVFVIQSETFLANATTSYLPGTNTELIFDDTSVQKELMGVFWGQFPTTYLFWLDDNNAVMLYADNMEAKQMNFARWRVSITYSIPDDNGSNLSIGTGGGETGPSAGEQNSQRYTQVSFNGSASKMTIQKAKVLECQKALALPAGEAIPFTAGFWYPIGVSEEEISGAEVYAREFKFQITQYLPPSRFTYAYVRRLSRLITCLNRFPFFGFAPESVMFMGYNGESDLYEIVPLTLEFEVKTNFAFYQQPNSIPTDPSDDFVSSNPPVIDYTQQYDIIGDSAFPPSAYANPLMGTGIYSGWSIVSYIYQKKILANSAGGILRIPSHRTVYGYYDTQDFNQFLL